MEPGIVWKNGMFTSPGNTPTEMIYYHDGSKGYLSGYVSILYCIDYCGSMGDCGFVIKGDGKVLWGSGIVKHHDAPVFFSIPLRGIHELRLITNSGGDNIDEDWGCWMELKVSKKTGKTDAVKVIKDDNILINGSFEEGGSVGSFKTLRQGDKIQGWTVTKATVDLNGTFLKAQDGKNSIDLNGTPGFGGIQQRFFTKKGKKYLLSFYLAGNPEGGPKIKKLLVSFGDQTRELEFDITGKSRENMGWEYHEFVFKAKQHATVLKFESNHKSGPTNWRTVTDNVKLVPYDKSKNNVVYHGNSSHSLYGLKYGRLAGGSYYFV
ncbi:MAG TPA: choice-of-anchor C family protein [Saprospiraceae bacterium]|nr:choice-of-anchor C family protein [Saprospiraceae bacterium]